jgi:hypothetical protein
MMATMRDEREVQRIAREIERQASRWRQATDEKEYLLHDLTTIEELVKAQQYHLALLFGGE